ncbi:MAG: hypothetical protein R3B84_16350 [Zavarzinella sp.]
MIKPDQNLIIRLRKMAVNETTICKLIDEIRSFLGTNDGLALVVDRYFCEAFHLPLGEVRVIEGSECFGLSLYTHEEIDRIILPRIAQTKHLWSVGIGN